MKQYQIISESDNKQSVVYTTTRKREAESFFNRLFRSFKKDEKNTILPTCVFLKNQGWFELTRFFNGNEYVTNYFITLS